VAKFFDVVGYGESVEISQGVWDDVITEVKYFGDVIRNTRQFEDSQKVNNDLTVGNSISIVADAYANEHIFAMRYVRWQGALWIVKTVEVQRPRLILRLGGVYNGPTATAPVSP
jgi:hypothetical protein